MSKWHSFRNDDGWWSCLNRQSDWNHRGSEQNRSKGESIASVDIDRADEHLPRCVRDDGQHPVHRKETPACRIRRELVQPAFRNDVLARDTAPGDEPQQDPQHWVHGNACKADNHSEERRQCRPHADVTDLTQRPKREPAAHHEAGVVGGAHRANDNGSKSFHLSANCDERGE